MKKYFIAFLLTLSLISTVTAQDSYRKINNALRYLKLGNSLREAQQFDLSEKYLNKGLQIIIEQGDKYWEAAFYEYLGLLYKELEKPEDASRNFTKALAIYRELKLSLSEKALEQMLNGAEGKTQYYGGIEIGAKGVKLSVLNVQLNSNREVEYVLKSDTSVNPEPAALTTQSQIETADALKKFMDLAKNKFGISNEHLFVVISSGLKQELESKNKQAEFIAAITPPNAAPGFSIHTVSSEEEAELSVLGTVPTKRRFSTSLLDIGSNKTNGGYFMEGSQTFNAVYLPVGTKSYVKMIKAQHPASINEFNHYAEILWRDSLSNMVIDEMSRRAGLRNRSATYLGGGIVWCIATYMFPDKVNDNYVEITPESVRRFRILLLNNYERAIQPDLSSISSEALVADAKKTISRAQNTYDQESLIAGAAWVDGLMRELNATQPLKRFYFSKYAYVGWISGYIARAVAEEYKKKTEQ